MHTYINTAPALWRPGQMAKEQESGASLAP